MNKFLRLVWFLFFIRPLVFLIMGVNIRNRQTLVSFKPAIIVANHNSHLDTMVLMSLFPLKLLPKLRPVAAADYFLKNRFLAWFALKIIGIIPLSRNVNAAKGDPLGECSKAIDNGEILILFPEGSRGEPEQLASFKSGVAHLAKRRPEVPIIPVFLYGLGKALPKGEFVLVPFLCDVMVGEKMHWTGNRNDFMELLEKRMKEMASALECRTWE